MNIRLINVEQQDEMIWGLDGEQASYIVESLKTNLPQAGDVLFHTTHYLVVNCVRNFDRGEIFIYLKPLYGFKPMEDNPLDYLKWSR